MFGRLQSLDAEVPGFLAELVAEFEEGVTRRLSAMARGVDAGDALAVGVAAHGMRGSCGTLGAVRMARLSARIEEIAPLWLEGAAALIRTLHSEYEAVRRALAAVRAAAAV